MTNWKVGMKVVCVEGHRCGDFNKGDVFTIKAIGVTPCCKNTTIDIGIRTHHHEMICSECDATYVNNNMYRASRFRPLQYDSNAATEVLIKFAPLEERSDAPVTKPEKQTA
jgi:hypothetical protein